MENSKFLRLDKYLSDMKVGSRSEIKQLVKKGSITVDDLPVKKSDQKVAPGISVIKVRGEIIKYEKYTYIMLHKPAGVVSATKDGRDRTVLDLLQEIPPKKRRDLFPVGRLDKDTEGLLLITNDGELSHRLLSPRKHVNKTYFAKVDGRVTQEDIRAFHEGLDIGDEKKTLPARLEIIYTDDISEIQVTVTEGRYHQIKRMFEARGKRVIYLKRLSMGALTLDKGLSPGEYRFLTREEIEELTCH